MFLFGDSTVINPITFSLRPLQPLGILLRWPWFPYWSQQFAGDLPCNKSDRFDQKNITAWVICSCRDQKLFQVLNCRQLLFLIQDAGIQFTCTASSVKSMSNFGSSLPVSATPVAVPPLMALSSSHFEADAFIGSSLFWVVWSSARCWPFWWLDPCDVRISSWWKIISRLVYLAIYQNCLWSCVLYSWIVGR